MGELDDRNRTLAQSADSHKAHEAAWKRYENLIELVRLAGEFKLPNLGSSENHQVFVAGVEIGHLNIQARKAWTLE